MISDAMLIFFFQDPLKKIPATHEITLHHGSKTVSVQNIPNEVHSFESSSCSCFSRLGKTLQEGSFFLQVSAMGLDPAGARLVTGGYDYDVKFWDFAGMDASLRHFRQIRPCERYSFT